MVAHLQGPGRGRRTTIKDQDLAWALRVRDALTSKVRENMGEPTDPAAIEFLNRAGEQIGLRVCFGCSDDSPIHVDATGVRGAIGRILGAAFLAELDGRWERFRICHDPGCSSVFFDQSKNQERQVVLHGFVREQSQGARVPGTAGGQMTSPMTTQKTGRTTTLELELRAPGGEPVDLWRTLDLPRIRGALAHRPGRGGSIPRLHGSRSRWSTAPGARVARARTHEPRGEAARPEGARALDVLGPQARSEGASRRSRGRGARPSARSRSVAVLSPSGEGPRPRVGGARRRPDAPLPHGLRGRREDGVHDQLRVERDGPDGGRARDPSGRPGARGRRAALERLPHARAMADAPEVLLSRRGQGRLSERLPDRTREGASPTESSISRRSRRRRPRRSPTPSSRQRSSPFPASGRTRRPTS